MNRVKPKNMRTIKSIKICNSKTSDGRDKILVLHATKTREKAIADKIKMLNTTILGIPLGSYEIGATREVLVPYALVSYAFSIQRRTIFNKNGHLDRHGVINLVFDLNEFHPFHYDESDGKKIDLRNIRKEGIKEKIIEPSRSKEDMLEKAEWYIQNRLLRRLYSTSGELTLKEVMYFYRRAVEIKVYSKGVENIRYAYYDSYGTGNEHIFGLKCRLG
jgi:hypothetical protein